jgi:hypothetical protein
MGRVEPERVLAYDDVRIWAAVGEELLQALGKSPSSDVDYSLGRV